MRFFGLAFIGNATAISPYAFHERLEACKTRAHTLRLQPGFVERCLEDAQVKGLEIYVEALEELRVDSVCEYRAISELFNGEYRIPGTVCDDSLLASDIPADCRYVMVTETPRNANTFSSTDFVDGRFVSQALTRLVSVHQRGFTVSLEPKLGNFYSDATLRLDPLRMRPLSFTSPQLVKRSIRSVKRDLGKFKEGLSERFGDESLIRDFGNWIRKIRIDRTEILAPTDYAEWITRFDDSVMKKRKVSEVPVPKLMLKTPAISEFLPLLSFCNHELQRAISGDRIEEGHEFKLVPSGETLRAMKWFPGGDNGEMFTTSDPTLLIKHALSRSEFCLELAALTALKGLRGRVPDLYEVENPIGRMMVMRRMGQANWPNADDPQRPSNEHLAQVIEVVRDLHETGFVHNDLHTGNVRWDDHGVYLIDFGSVSPVHISGGDPLETRRTDMILLAEYIITPSAVGGLEMVADMDALDDDERPDYEKWIRYFSPKT